MNGKLMIGLVVAVTMGMGLNASAQYGRRGQQGRTPHGNMMRGNVYRGGQPGGWQQPRYTQQPRRFFNSNRGYVNSGRTPQYTRPQRQQYGGGGVPLDVAVERQHARASRASRESDQLNYKYHRVIDNATHEASASLHSGQYYSGRFGESGVATPPPPPRPSPSSSPEVLRAYAKAVTRWKSDLEYKWRRYHQDTVTERAKSNEAQRYYDSAQRKLDQFFNPDPAAEYYESYRP